MVNSEDLHMVQRLPLFRSMGEKEIAKILRSSTIQRHEPGTLLFDQGEVPQHLHVLLGGLVELIRGEASQECGLLILAAEDVFMPAAALFDEPYLNAARVLTPARVLLLDAGVAREELFRCHQFAINISRTLAGQFRMATRHIIDLKCRSAAQRLAAFLLRVVEESPLPDKAQLPLQKRQLASRIGVTAETLSRTIQVVAENGLVLRGSTITVRDRGKLEEFLGPSPYPEPAEATLGVHAM